MASPTLTSGAVQRLREAFARADYTADGVQALLGPVAQEALGRGETVPARRATSGGTALETLVRLFPLQLAVPATAAAAALPLRDLLAGGLVTRDGDEVRAAVDVRPYAEADDRETSWWVVSDLGTGLDGVTAPLPSDHVVGLGGASTTLAQLTVRRPVARTLDLGTGSGVQALHATRHSGRVVATDVSARALAMAALTTALSGVEVELRRGSFLEPVAGEQFDLVVSNPPFVVSPVRRHSYRDGGLALDGVTALLAGESPRHLAAGGTAALLGNWVHRRGEPWEERVAGWLPGDGFDALVVQRETQDPAAYVATWLRDSGDAGGPGYRERYDEWLGALEHAGVEAVGFGTVSVRRTDAAARTEVLDWPHAVEQPLGPHVDALFSRWAWLRSHLPATELAAARLRLSDGVVQEQWGQPGAEDPARLVLRQQHGLRRAVECDTALAAFAGACDGSVAVGPLVAAVATVLGIAPGEAAQVLLPQVRSLLAEGFLEPAGGTFSTSPSGHLPV